MEIVARLSADDGERAVAEALELRSFLRQPEGVALVAVCVQGLAVAKQLIRHRETDAAMQMLAAIEARIEATPGGEAREVAALTQLWSVIAAMYGGDEAATIAHTERVDAIGSSIGPIVDHLLGQLNGQAFWHGALIMLLAVKIQALESSGADTSAKELKQGFIAAWRDSGLPAAKILIARYGEELTALRSE